MKPGFPRLPIAESKQQHCWSLSHLLHLGLPTSTPKLLRDLFQKMVSFLRDFHLVVSYLGFLQCNRKCLGSSQRPSLRVCPHLIAQCHSFSSFTSLKRSFAIWVLSVLVLMVFSVMGWHISLSAYPSDTAIKPGLCRYVPTP